MKITRHAAPDMRQALRAVRDRLGPEAVILSSRRTPTGVEVTAAMDFDAENPPTEADLALAVAVEPVAPPPPLAAQQTLRHPLAAEAPAADHLLDERPTGTAASPAPEESALSATMQSELKTLRRMLETQLARLAWNDLARRAPIHTEMLRELTEVGLAPDLAAEVVSAVPAGTELTLARRLAIATVAQKLLVTGDRWLQEGGRIALVGPTGVGKTTLLAKLAVRWALLHGTRDLALIAADSQRLGAHDQVQSLGQLLGAPVYPLEDFAELPALLGRLSQHRFVLIDTPGSSQRDAQLAARLAALAAAGCGLETALVLAASTQAGAVAEAVKRFAPAGPTSCVLTKVDEAASLGGTLSVLVRSRLPISYVSEGQRVPEDLRPARALELVSSAVQLAQASGAAADEDLLKRRFGEVAHGLA
ncbi:MAG TPA: flagellar biosynthesis protein FlhF [Steroidobacteraceae bacterium]|nr:flagellar biosynthesis protein FlhF [Steroidobacteraceae bacterium]